MMVGKRLGWVMIAALALASVPATTHAKKKKAKAPAASTAAEPARASDSDLDGRVRAIEKKLDMQQKTEAADQKSVRQRVDSIEKEVKDAEQSIADKLGFDLHAFVAGSYLYNFNAPTELNGRHNTLRVFDNDANTFTLDQVNLNVSRKKEEGLGFAVNLDFGKAAEIVGGSTHWSNPKNAESADSIELREAYLTYKLKLGDGITFKAGKFVTLLGAEIIPNFDNQNANISRSISFGFGIPFTHTGLLVNVPLGSVVSIDAGVVNGWENVVDNNNAKSFLGGINVAPADAFSMYLSGVYGAEQDDHTASKRGVMTAVFTIKPSDTVTLMAEGTYGHETQIVGPTLQDGADWYGGAAYVILKASDDLSFAFRGEVFDDTDGTRFISDTTVSAVATALGRPTLPTTAWEITPTVAYRLSNGLTWRAEYRHDEASKRIFLNSNDNVVRGQDTIATQLVYAF